MEPFLTATAEYLLGDAHPNTIALAKEIEGHRSNMASQQIAAPAKGPIACKLLPLALQSSNAIDLVHPFSNIAEDLAWWDAPKGKLTAGMDDNHAAVEIIGPDGLFSSEKLRFGAFLIAPDTTYPLHSHAAEEIYIPISGTGQWQIEADSFQAHPVGSTIHVKSWIPHALRTQADPLLMLWAWFGNISFDDYRIE